MKNKCKFVGIMFLCILIVDVYKRQTVEVTQIEKGQPFIYTAEVAVRPEVTLGKYMGDTVTKIDTSVSDEEVDACLLYTSRCV